MYDVAQFVKSKREDWDNGCGPTERADLDAFRYERTRSDAGTAVRMALRMEGPKHPGFPVSIAGSETVRLGSGDPAPLPDARWHHDG